MTKRFIDGRFELGQVITGGIEPHHLFPAVVIGEFESPGGNRLIVQTEEAIAAGEDEPESWGLAAGEAWVIDPSYVYSDTYPPTDINTASKETR